MTSVKAYIHRAGNLLFNMLLNGTMGSNKYQQTLNKDDPKKTLKYALFADFGSIQTLEYLTRSCKTSWGECYNLNCELNYGY